MKNKGLIVSLIIFLSIVVVGITITFVGLLNNKVNFPRIAFGHKISKELILDETYKQEFKKIDITSTMGNIKVKNSKDNQIRVEVYGEKENLEVATDNDILAIKYKDKSCIGICINYEMAKIIVYLPKEYNQLINLKNNYGDIEVANLKQATINIDEDCGDVKIDQANKVDINNNYGDIKINSVTNANIDEDCGDVEIRKVSSITAKNNFGNINIGAILDYVKLNVDCGDINIDNLNITKNSSIKNNYGDIKVKKTNDIFIDSHVDLGDNKVKKNNRKSSITLQVENDCGDVNIN